jgi:hypothetical protein
MFLGITYEQRWKNDRGDENRPTGNVCLNILFIFFVTNLSLIIYLGFT